MLGRVSSNLLPVFKLECLFSFWVLRDFDVVSLQVLCQIYICCPYFLSACGLSLHFRDLRFWLIKCWVLEVSGSLGQQKDVRTTPFEAVYLKYKWGERSAPGLSCADRCLKLSLIPSPLSCPHLWCGFWALGFNGVLQFLPSLQPHWGPSSPANTNRTPERAVQLLARVYSRLKEFLISNHSQALKW